MPTAANKSRWILGEVILTSALCLLAVGCANQDAPLASTDRPLPPMPTMGPSRNAPSPIIAKSDLIASATRQALANDLPAMLRTLDGAKDAIERAEVSAALVDTLATQDPKTATTVALTLPKGPGRTSAIEVAGRGLARRDVDAALRWAMGLPESADATPAKRSVAAEMIHQSPSGTMEKIKGLPTSATRDDMLAVAAAVWASQTPDDAISWMQQQPDDELRQQLTSYIAFEIAQKNPNRAIALAESLPAGRNRWLIYSAIAQTWAAVDTKAALAWATQLPAGEARESAIAGFQTGLGIPASRRSRGTPDTNSIARNRGNRTAAFAAGPELNSSDFAAWLATQPQSMSRDQAILEYVRQRGAADQGAIGNWLANLSGEPSRQQAMEIYFAEALRRSPADAANWLRSLPSADRTDAMIEKTAREWIQRDPNAAAAWLRETNLPLYRQEELLQQARH